MRTPRVPVGHIQILPPYENLRELGAKSGPLLSSASIFDVSLVDK